MDVPVIGGPVDSTAGTVLGAVSGIAPQALSLLSGLGV
jgi:hypothetical protein